MFWAKPTTAATAPVRDSGTPSSLPALSFLQSDHDARGIDRWLSDTPMLQLEHQKIRLTAQRLTQLKHTARQKAVACFAYVRAMPFGCVTDSTSTPASSVLRHGRGDCHTKGTLMVALLRASGVPARLRFVSLRPDFLHGIMDLAGQPVEHAMAEVWVDDQWVAVDSYVTDQKLALAARVCLSRESRKLGYGMHIDGSVTWDGLGAAFGQFALSDPASLPLHDWGAFDDPHQFYSTVSYVRERLNWSNRAKWAVGAAVVNRRVNALRNSIDSVAA